MDTDKAYLFGLIIGGGVFGSDENKFIIRLPYKKWGSYIDAPHRTPEIADDILRKVGQMFRAIYSITVQYEASESGTWIILCEGDMSSLKDDFAKYNISCQGELRKNVDIRNLASALLDANLKRRFIAGLADTIGSMVKSQRRFSDEHQIISFEISGYNYSFVCSLCNLLYSIGCFPDQINWNHPNIHCSLNPSYSRWNKGFKLRVLLDQYTKFGAFAFKAKVRGARQNLQLQQSTHSATKCEDCDLNLTLSTIHPSEHDPRLPEHIRGGHYIHFRHFCAVLGCPHAPYQKIRSHLDNIGNFITPFPIICKGTKKNIQHIINTHSLYSDRHYTDKDVSVRLLLEKYNRDNKSLLYEKSPDAGYPLKNILQAVAFVIADPSDLKGTRPKGGYISLIKRYMANNENLTVVFRIPDLLTPLHVLNGDKAALIGALNPSVYSNLISFSESNEYKIIAREITAEDLHG